MTERDEAASREGVRPFCVCPRALCATLGRMAARYLICSFKSPSDAAVIIEQLRKDFPPEGRTAEVSADPQDKTRWNLTMGAAGAGDARFFAGWVMGYLRHGQLIERMHPVEVIDLLEQLLEQHQAKAEQAIARAERKARRARGDEQQALIDHVAQLEAHIAELEARKPRRRRDAAPPAAAPDVRVAPDAQEPQMRPRTARERILSPTPQEHRLLGEGGRVPLFEDEQDDDDDPDGDG